MVAVISRLLEEQGKEPPVVIGGCALSYYSREVYFTADIDLAYGDREVLNAVLTDLGFSRAGRYWVNNELKMAVEAPVSSLEGAPLEEVEIGEGGLKCLIIGLEDLIIDRMNACKYWKSEIDCEMVEVLIKRYLDVIDWSYIEGKASLPENNVFEELSDMRRKAV